MRLVAMLALALTFGLLIVTMVLLIQAELERMARAQMILLDPHHWRCAGTARDEHGAEQCVRYERL